jgi:hypothetical protein
MKKLLLAMLCVTSFLSVQGCFWHSHTERTRVIDDVDHVDRTTVVTPDHDDTTVTTTTTR